MKLFNELRSLEHALDARSTRHTLLAGNLANIDTPGYRPKDIDFDATMRAMTVADAGAGDAARLPISAVSVEEAEPGLDGNRVNLDAAVADLAENGMQYAAASRAVGKKLAIMRYVVSDGVG